MVMGTAPFINKYRGKLLLVWGMNGAIPFFINPSGLFSRVSKNLRKWWNVSCYDSSGTNECKGTDGDAAHDGGIRANTCTALHQGRPEFLFAFNKCPGIDNIGKDH